MLFSTRYLNTHQALVDESWDLSSKFILEQELRAATIRASFRLQLSKNSLALLQFFNIYNKSTIESAWNLQVDCVIGLWRVCRLCATVCSIVYYEKLIRIIIWLFSYVMAYTLWRSIKYSATWVNFLLKEIIYRYSSLHGFEPSMFALIAKCFNQPSTIHVFSKTTAGCCYRLSSRKIF